MSLLAADRLWQLSRTLYENNHPRAARCVKGINFHLNHCLLPFQARVGVDLKLEHHGLGIVIHPNVEIGDRVQLWQHVTIAAETWLGSPYGVVIGDDVMIGAGAVLIARRDAQLHIGRGARIGAGAVVTRDVEPDTTYVGAAARPVTGRGSNRIHQTQQ